ncbi:MAG: hypothetical protein IPN76_21040 [Saprospiraceae bacterium]|nr:hypothetical protein [Saprospiraceae bacterium]
MKRIFQQLIFLFAFMNYSELNSQDWISYDQEEEFPLLPWGDIEDTSYASYEAYSSKVYRDFERTKKEFGFKSYHFDAELGDHLEDFEEIIDSILHLLPENCHREIVSAYQDEKTQRWTVDVLVNQASYKFSTQALGGDYIDSEDLFRTLNKIVLTHAPGYEIVIPDIHDGQVMGLLIERSDIVRKASLEGFPAPPFSVEWQNKPPNNLHLHCANCILPDDSIITANYIQVFNEFYSNHNTDHKLSLDNFRICDGNGNGLLYICLNGKIIGTPNKYENRIACSSNLSDFIFGYALGKMNGCLLYLADSVIQKRRLIPIEELKEMIEKGI